LLFEPVLKNRGDGAKAGIQILPDLRLLAEAARRGRNPNGPEPLF
jgi:hypothetical protein